MSSFAKRLAKAKEAQAKAKAEAKNTTSVGFVYDPTALADRIAEKLVKDEKTWRFTIKVKAMELWQVDWDTVDSQKGMILFVRRISPSTPKINFTIRDTGSIYCANREVDALLEQWGIDAKDLGFSISKRMDE